MSGKQSQELFDHAKKIYYRCTKNCSKVSNYEINRKEMVISYFTKLSFQISSKTNY